MPVTPQILQLAGISIAVHIITRSVEKITTLGNHLRYGLEGNELPGATSNARAPHRSYSVAYSKRTLPPEGPLMNK
jgi:hypothetical protein